MRVYVLRMCVFAASAESVHVLLCASVSVRA